MKPQRSLLALRAFAIALVMIAASMVVKAQMTVDVPFKLSEIWLPGIDGVVVLTTSGKHEHQTVTGRLADPSR